MLYIAIAFIVLGVSVIFFSLLKKEREVIHGSTIVRKRHPVYPDDDILHAAVTAEMDGYGDFEEQRSAEYESRSRDVKIPSAADEHVCEDAAGEVPEIQKPELPKGGEFSSEKILADSNSEPAIPAGTVKEGVSRLKNDEIDIAYKNKREAGRVSPEDNNVYAVLFNDYSGDLEYDGSDNAIDPTFSKYSALKRVGRGMVAVVKDGINFKLDKNLYRFDFHRIRDIQGGDNYIAVNLKGSHTVRLFLIENDDYKMKIIRDFADFCRKG